MIRGVWCCLKVCPLISDRNSLDSMFLGFLNRNNSPIDRCTLADYVACPHLCMTSSSYLNHGIPNRLCCKLFFLFFLKKK